MPPIILGLAKHPLVDSYDLSSLKTIVSGAAPLAREVGNECAARLGVAVKQARGRGENCGTLWYDLQVRPPGGYDDPDGALALLLPCG